MFTGVLELLTVNLTLTRSLALETGGKGRPFPSNIESERANLGVKRAEVGVTVDSGRLIRKTEGEHDFANRTLVDERP